MKKSSLEKRHFTLIELLVVITIIGILSAIILPALAGANKSAKETQIKSQLQNIVLAAIQYHGDYGQLPCDNSTGSDITVNPFDSTHYGYLNGGNPRGIVYYSSGTENFNGGDIILYFDADYDNTLTIDTETISVKVAATSQYDGETLKSWVK